MVNFGSGFNIRERKWTEFREEISIRGGSLQYDTLDDAYQIYFTDDSEIFNCIIYTGLVPSSITQFYSQEQNDADKNEFIGYLNDSTRPAQLSFATANPGLIDAFNRVSVTTDNFDDMEINWTFNAEHILLSLEGAISGDIVEYSFNGINMHGDMRGRTTSEAVAYDNRLRNKIWLRRNSSSPSSSITIRIEAWR